MLAFLFFPPYFGAAKVPSCYYSCLENAMVLAHMQVSDLRASAVLDSLVFGFFVFLHNDPPPPPPPLFSLLFPSALCITVVSFSGYAFQPWGGIYHKGAKSG